MLRRARVSLSLALLTLSCAGPSNPSTAAAVGPAPDATELSPADLIFHEARVWTGDESHPRAQAVAVRGDRIVAVGDDAEVLELRGHATRVVDLDGKLLLPGFNDNHVHFASAAAFLEFNVMKTSTHEEFAAKVQEVVQTLPKGDWIVGGYWGAYDQWAEGSAGSTKRKPFAPDMAAIAELTADHPVFIRKFDDSEFAVNAAAMKAAGLDAKRPRAKGVKFLRHKGKLTGIIRGKGVTALFDKVVPKTFSHDRRVNQTLNALAEIRKHGVTNVSDMSDDEQLAIYRELHEAGKLTVRVHFRYHLERYEELAKQGIKVGSGDEWIRLGGLKGHIDGIMGTSGARFLEPYDHEPKNRGRWRRLMVDEEGKFEEGKFLGYMAGADKAGMQLTVHAIGDEANRLLLDYLDALDKQNGPKDRRFRLVHAQVIHPDDMPRLGKLGVVAEVQPFHLSDDMRWMEERIGARRCAGAYAFRSIVDSGAVLSFGTDWPGTSAAEYPIDPMLGLYAAVTRQTLAGDPKQGWFPAQRISMEEALRAYTAGTAYANFEEDSKGSITEGKLADLAVVSQNLLEIEPAKIPQTKVLYTVVGGKIVYEAQQ